MPSASGIKVGTLSVSTDNTAANLQVLVFDALADIEYDFGDEGYDDTRAGDSAYRDAENIIPRPNMRIRFDADTDANKSWPVLSGAARNRYFDLKIPTDPNDAAEGIHVEGVARIARRMTRDARGRTLVEVTFTGAGSTWTTDGDVS